MIEFEGRCAVITGASSGIGRATAFALAERGMDVVAVGRDAERLQQVAARVSAFGVRVRTVSCDVSDAEAVSGLAREVYDEYGAVEFLMLNAGISTTGAQLEHDLADWKSVYDTVVMGVVHGMLEFVPRMMADGRGHVVITGSFTALAPDYFLNHGPYVPAKAAVHALTANLRAELADTGVGVSLLAPAGVNTGMSAAIRASMEASKNSKAHAARPPRQALTRRVGSPEPTRPSQRLEPEDVAERVIEGVQRDAAIIITHPEYRPIIVDYQQRLLDAVDSVSAKGTVNDDS